MMDWSTPHFRHFQRLLTRRTRLYTEMHVVNKLIHMEQDKMRSHLGNRSDSWDENGAGIALQIGGNDPDMTWKAVKRVSE